MSNWSHYSHDWTFQDAVSCTGMKSKSGRIWIKKLPWYLLNAGRVTMTQMRNKWSFGFLQYNAKCADHSTSLFDKKNGWKSKQQKSLCLCVSVTVVDRIVSGFFCLSFVAIAVVVTDSRFSLLLSTRSSYCTKQKCVRAHTLKRFRSTIWKCIKQKTRNWDCIAVV